MSKIIASFCMIGIIVVYYSFSLSSGHSFSTAVSPKPSSSEKVLTGKWLKINENVYTLTPVTISDINELIIYLGASTHKAAKYIKINNRQTTVFLEEI